MSDVESPRREPTQATTVRLDRQLHRLTLGYAIARRIPFRRVVERALEDYLAKRFHEDGQLAECVHRLVAVRAKAKP
jgi:hypothetical protein